MELMPERWSDAALTVVSDQGGAGVTPPPWKEPPTPPQPRPSNRTPRQGRAGVANMQPRCLNQTSREGGADDVTAA